ncbi:hypothetical protein [Nocardioides bruguierae]|uniref:Uncharacterized protein n=1 Tax=Nocardioides bruguierae TaxID=2945102 RepID=A0A9X2IDT4_9ACTN|nr:hypothetical protein [Nocardioides bruguierae]MCM0620091.1 hypothetical protein [Nocardioides bruguierae]
MPKTPLTTHLPARTSRGLRRGAVAAVVPLLALTALVGCSSDGEGEAGTSTAAEGSPTVDEDAIADPDVALPSVPTSSEPITTRSPVTVLDEGDGPVACLGPILSSVPPQCTGTDLAGFAFDDQPRASSTTKAGTTYGEYQLTGTWDGETYTVTEAVPAARYDGPTVPVADPSTPLRRYEDAQLTTISAELSGVPGITSTYVGASKQVVALTPWDDGTIQAYADEAYGLNVVQVVSVLVTPQS